MHQARTKSACHGSTICTTMHVNHALKALTSNGGVGAGGGGEEKGSGDEGGGKGNRDKKVSAEFLKVWGANTSQT